MESVCCSVFAATIHFGQGTSILLLGDRGRSALSSLFQVYWQVWSIWIKFPVIVPFSYYSGDPVGSGDIK